MKARFIGSAAMIGALLIGSAMAQDKSNETVDEAPAPPPLPPKVKAPGPGLEPTVTITTGEDGQIIEEYRHPGGQVYMVKVTPESGIPYYLYDPDGDGEFVADDDSDPGLAPVTWKVKEWK